MVITEINEGGLYLARLDGKGYRLTSVTAIKGGTVSVTDAVVRLEKNGRYTGRRNHTYQTMDEAMQQLSKCVELTDTDVWTAMRNLFLLSYPTMMEILKGEWEKAMDNKNEEQ